MSRRLASHGRVSAHLSHRLTRTAILLSFVANAAVLGGYGYHHWASVHHPHPLAAAKADWRALMKALRLSPDQRQAIHSAVATTTRDIAVIRRQIRQRRLDLVDLLAAPHPDRDAIEATRQKIAGHQQAIQQMMIGKILDHKTILTKEQQATLFASLKARLEQRLQAGDP